MSGALLVAGTTSDAGKSMVVAGLCRLLARKGIRVAPFKAQNMSNNSAVTVEVGEIGRAQAMQARAAGLEPSVRFNPVLLKPGSDRTSQLVLRGQVVDTVSAKDYFTHRDRLAAVVADELHSLRNEFDAVICEGAGSPAEINLRATDLANMGLARAATLPVILVGDIDRGGLLAHLYGTVAVLEPDDQRLISGFVVNKFRGDPALLAPGLDQLERLTGRPTYGVIPYTDGLWLDTEDSVSVLAHRVVGEPQPPRGEDWLRVAAIRLPRISNSTDVEALACEPGVLVRWVTDPADLADADVVVIPGSKATVLDLSWLRERGLADGIAAHARQGRPVLGICGGFQMLCGASTTRWSRSWASSTASACSMPTSRSRRTRLCVTGTRHYTATKSTTARSKATPRTTGWVSASAAAPCTARTGMGCSTTMRCAGSGWPTPRQPSADPGSSSPTTSTCPLGVMRNWI